MTPTTSKWSGAPGHPPAPRSGSYGGAIRNSVSVHALYVGPLQERPPGRAWKPAQGLRYSRRHRVRQVTRGISAHGDSALELRSHVAALGARLALHPPPCYPQWLAMCTFDPLRGQGCPKIVWFVYTVCAQMRVVLATMSHIQCAGLDIIGTDKDTTGPSRTTWVLRSIGCRFFFYEEWIHTIRTRTLTA
jgi:hypothetical protein